MKMETLKTHESQRWSNFVPCHVIGERMEVTPMISTDPQNVYHFGYPLFWTLPDLTKLNSFNDLNRNTHCFIKSTADIT